MYDFIMKKILKCLILSLVLSFSILAEDENENVIPVVICKENNGFSRTPPKAIVLEASSTKVVKLLNNDPCSVYPKVVKKIKKSYPKMSIDSITQAFAYRKKNSASFTGNPRYLMVADYSQNADKVRSMQIDLYTGEVVGRKVSHGRTSDKGSGNSGVFSGCKVNKKRTNATRPGFFKVENTYASSGSCETKKSNGELNSYGKYLKKYGKKPKYGCSHGEFRDKNGKLEYGWPYLGKGYPADHNGMRMKGLVKGVNDKAKANGVVMHGAWYNQGSGMGRSYGCPAFHPDEFRSVADALKDGALYYSYTPKCEDDMKLVLKTIPNWKKACSI